MKLVVKGKEPETESKAWTITTTANTAVKVLEGNDDRIVWSAINISDTDVYFGYDDLVATSGDRKGVLVAANGGSIEDEHSKDDVYVICTASGKEVNMVETAKRRTVGGD